jgi:hypothetical protein
MRFFRVLIGVFFLLWSAACTYVACDQWRTINAIRETTRGPVDELSAAQSAWLIALLMAFGTFGVGGYLVTKK